MAHEEHLLLAAIGNKVMQLVFARRPISFRRVESGNLDEVTNILNQYEIFFLDVDSFSRALYTSGS